MLTRNIHRWAAHLMVFFVFLHMMRVFYHGAYKPPREFNWVVGVVLLFLTVLLSFTGYLLPWDQIAYWAITIGTNMANYAPLLNKPSQLLLLGGIEVGQNTLLRFYVLPRDPAAAGRGDLPGGPLLADPQGRRDLRTAMSADLQCTARSLTTEWLAAARRACRTADRPPVTRPLNDAARARRRLPADPTRTTEIDKQRVPMAAKPYRLLALVKQDAVVRVQKEPDDTVMTWPHLLVDRVLRGRR